VVSGLVVRGSPAWFSLWNMTSSLKGKDSLRGWLMGQEENLKSFEALLAKVSLDGFPMFGDLRRDALAAGQGYASESAADFQYEHMHNDLKDKIVSKAADLTKRMEEHKELTTQEWFQTMLPCQRFVRNRRWLFNALRKQADKIREHSMAHNESVGEREKALEAFVQQVDLIMNEYDRQRAPYSLALTVTKFEDPPVDPLIDLQYSLWMPGNPNAREQVSDH